MNYCLVRVCEEREEKDNYYRCEISRGAFTRTIALPAEVDDSIDEGRHARAHPAEGREIQAPDHHDLLRRA